MPIVSGTSTGGLSILSYMLEWNQGGTGDAYVPLVGSATNSLSTTFTQSSLTTG